MILEEWVNDPRSAYLELMDFLEIDDDGRFSFDPIHIAKNVRSSSIARLTQRPPSTLLAILKIIKRTLRVSRLNIASQLRALNTRDGYSDGKKDPELDDEIRKFFSNDQDQLRKILAELDECGTS